VKFLKTNSLINIFFIFVLFYLIYHTLYGRLNIGNYLIYKYEHKMYIKLQEKLNIDMFDLNIDLQSFYSNKDDYIDEITKQKNTNPVDGEIIIKLD
tara:strand:+ start:1747 stop:2034 length:288 start_codon:yes stop_codon:yes gene_type:complete